MIIIKERRVTEKFYGNGWDIKNPNDLIDCLEEALKVLKKAPRTKVVSKGKPISIFLLKDQLVSGVINNLWAAANVGRDYIWADNDLRLSQ